MKCPATPAYLLSHCSLHFLSSLTFPARDLSVITCETECIRMHRLSLGNTHNWVIYTQWIHKQLKKKNFGSLFCPKRANLCSKFKFNIISQMQIRLRFTVIHYACLVYSKSLYCMHTVLCKRKLFLNYVYVSVKL